MPWSTEHKKPLPPRVEAISRKAFKASLIAIAIINRVVKFATVNYAKVTLDT